jgi:hypothetical protein
MGEINDGKELSPILGAMALFATGYPALAVLLPLVAGAAVVAYYLRRRK